jgi:hypothetical protein
MTNKRKSADITRQAEMSPRTALTWFAVALLLAMMLSSCASSNNLKGTGCYYFADKTTGGAIK